MKQALFNMVNAMRTSRGGHVQERLLPGDVTVVTPMTALSADLLRSISGGDNVTALPKGGW
jgi:hypothetical protein